MSPILAIAGLALRGAVRSRVVMALVFLIALIQLVLPLTVEGDGTVTGQLNLTLRYTLGAVMFLLSLVTVWSGCAAVSSELHQKQIQMLITKPVHAVHLWLGKWLGLLVLNAGLLIFSCVLTYGLMKITFTADKFEAGNVETELREIWRTRQPLEPVYPGLAELVEQAVDQRITALKEQGQAVNREDFASAFQRQALTEQNRLAPGQDIRWTFRLPQTIHSTVPLQLTFRYATSSIGESNVPGDWTVTTGGNPLLKTSTDNPSGQTHAILIPAEGLKGGEEISVTFKPDATVQDTTIFSAPDIRLRLYRHSFFLNLVKANMLMFIHLAFLSAVGVTAGSLFSLPVAALISGYTLLLLQADDYIKRMAGSSDYLERSIPFLDLLMGAVFNILSIFLAPLEPRPVLEWLTQGIWIEPSVVVYDSLVKGLGYALILAAIGISIFRNREVALPQ